MYKYCQKCVYPIFTVNLDIDETGVCSACRTFEEITTLSKTDWDKREKKIIEIIESYKKITKGDYDCIIPVGGGKDSYYQAHYIKSLGFKPLLVTYYGNNFLPEGDENLHNMSKKIGCDHFIFKPSEDLLIKLNRAAFFMMGDMNWHNHAGIRMIAPKTAIQFQVPLFIFGEVSWDISGMFSINNYSEFNKRSVLEHDMRGFTAKDFVSKENLTSKDLAWYQLPEDDEYFNNNLKGIYLGNFIYWDPYKQTDLMKKLYNWQESKTAFERTYRKISNLDDMHENGIHDYLKFIKFGYGRASDHASKDIRMGYMTRLEAIEMVKKYDSVKPTTDLKRWLEYVGMLEDEFDRKSETFRDPRVWKKDKNNIWTKDNIWD